MTRTVEVLTMGDLDGTELDNGQSWRRRERR